MRLREFEIIMRSLLVAVTFYFLVNKLVISNSTDASVGDNVTSSCVESNLTLSWSPIATLRGIWESTNPLFLLIAIVIFWNTPFYKLLQVTTTSSFLQGYRLLQCRLETDKLKFTDCFFYFSFCFPLGVYKFQSLGYWSKSLNFRPMRSKIFDCTIDQLYWTLTNLIKSKFSSCSIGGVSIIMCKWETPLTVCL